MMSEEELKILEALAGHVQLSSIQVAEKAFGGKYIPYEHLRSHLSILEALAFVRKTIGNQSNPWMWQITPIGREALKNPADIDKTQQPTETE